MRTRAARKERGCVLALLPEKHRSYAEDSTSSTDGGGDGAVRRYPERRRAFGEAGKQVVERRVLTWDRFAADVAEVYERALMSAAQPGRRPRPWIPL